MVVSIAALTSGAAWVLVETLWNNILVLERRTLESISITAYYSIHV